MAQPKGLDDTAATNPKNIPKPNQEKDSNIRQWDAPLSLQNPNLTYWWAKLINHLLSCAKRLEKPLNILFFGASGVGKTSIISTIRTALSSSLKPFRVGPTLPLASLGSVTRRLQVISIPGTNINLIDIPGVTNKGYKNGLFKKILDGEIDPNMILTEEKQDDLGPSLPKNRLKIHGAILVLDGKEGRAGDTNSIWNVDLTNLVKILLEKVHAPSVIVNKVDRLDGDLILHPEKTYTSRAVTKEIHRIKHSAVQIPLASIYPAKGYTFERQRSKVIELMALLAFKQAFDDAVGKLMNDN